jgi:hypothetical protein
MPPPRSSKLATIFMPERLSASGDCPSVRFLYGKVLSMLATGTTALVPNWKTFAFGPSRKSFE